MEEINASIGFDKRLCAPGHRAAPWRTPPCWRQQGIMPREDVAADRARARGRRGRDRERRLHVLARARGHPHERRGRLARAHRRAGRAAAHRALAQRPGRDRLAAVGARRDRRARRRSSPTLQTRARREGAGAIAGAVMPGFTHLQSAQPVTFGHHLLAYVEMLGARPRPLRRRAPAPERVPARRRGARRHVVPDRPRT